MSRVFTDVTCQSFVMPSLPFFLAYMRVCDCIVLQLDVGTGSYMSQEPVSYLAALSAQATALGLLPSGACGGLQLRSSIVHHLSLIRICRSSASSVSYPACVVWHGCVCCMPCVCPGLFRYHCARHCSLRMMPSTVVTIEHQCSWLVQVRRLLHRFKSVLQRQPQRSHAHAT